MFFAFILEFFFGQVNISLQKMKPSTMHKEGKMVSKVYFVDFKSLDAKESTVLKIKKLFDKAGFKSLMKEGDLTAVKVHFGERGNDGYINPVYVRLVVDKIKEAGAKPFVTDTNTLYIGERHNAVDHMTVALEHGFNFAVLNAPTIIAGGLKSGSSTPVEVNLKHFKQTKIATDIVQADSMIVMSHVKGHPMAGFGGAVKNLAMGCATAEGKKDQHSLRPEVDQDKCVGCRKCSKVCPAGAISYETKKAFIDKTICIGCGECVHEWEKEMENFVERLTEYAKGAVTGKEGKVGYINFLVKITPDCDCFPYSDRAIVPDIGILAGTDPVAVDKASIDLINAQEGFENSRLEHHCHAGEDKFTGLRPNSKGMVQLTYGEKIGLGSQEYELVKI